MVKPFIQIGNRLLNINHISMMHWAESGLAIYTTAIGNTGHSIVINVAREHAQEVLKAMQQQFVNEGFPKLERL